MRCTCAGTAPGYPQHESYCGQREDDDERCEHCRSEPCECFDSERIAEERLKARDYDAWASL